MNPHPINGERSKARLVSACACACALVVIAPLALVLLNVLRKGASSLDWNF